MRILEQRLWEIGESMLGAVQQIVLHNKTDESLGLEIQQNPSDTFLWTQRMAIRMRTGDSDGALALFDEAPKETSSLCYIKAMCLVNKNGPSAYPQAIAIFQRALYINPLDLETRTSLATIYNRLDRHDEALELWNDLIGMSPDCADAWMGRSRCYYNLGNLQKAIKAITASLFCLDTGYSLSMIQEGKEKVHAAYLVNRADAYLETGETKKALADFKKALAYEPHNKKAAMLSSQTLIETNPREAARIFSKFREYHMGDADWHMGAMATYAINEDLRGVEQSFSDMKNTLGSDFTPFHQYSYGISLRKGGWFSKASPVLEKVLQTTNDQKLRQECYQELLQIFTQLRENEKLQTYLARAMQEGFFFQPMTNF